MWVYFNAGFWSGSRVGAWAWRLCGRRSSGFDAELLSCGVTAGHTIGEGLGDQVPISGVGLVVLREVALVNVFFVRAGRGEDQDQSVLAAVGREVGVQDCSLARSAVSRVALA